MSFDFYWINCYLGLSHEHPGCGFRSCLELACYLGSFLDFQLNSKPSHTWLREWRQGSETPRGWSYFTDKGKQSQVTCNSVQKGRRLQHSQFLELNKQSRAHKMPKYLQADPMLPAIPLRTQLASTFWLGWSKCYLGRSWNHKKAVLYWVKRGDFLRSASLNQKAPHLQPAWDIVLSLCDSLALNGY